MPSPQHKQRGVAVLTAMLVVAIGTMIAVDLLWDETLDQHRTAAALAADQGLMYVEGAEAWAGQILQQDLAQSPGRDKLDESWATRLPPLPIVGGSLSAHLEDLQGRLNLNNLVKPDGDPDPLMMARFQRLLALVDLDPSLALAVVDWIDPDSKVHFPAGAEDANYTRGTPPYRTANTLITSPSALMAVKGFDRESYLRLAPYVSALPRGTRLNVNTASALVLASLSNKLDLTKATELVKERGKTGFDDINATFINLVPPKVLQRLGGSTDYFMLTTIVRLGNTQLTAYSVLQRAPSGVTRTVFRSLGGY